MNFIDFQYGFDEACKTPVEKCTAKGGPSECRFHKCNATFLDTPADIIDLCQNKELATRIAATFSKPSDIAIGKNKEAVSAGIEAAKMRFPWIKIGNIYVAHGQSKDDVSAGGHLRIHGVGGEMIDVVFLGDIDESRMNGYSFIRPGDNKYGDVFRHELGHCISTRFSEKQLSYYEQDAIERVGIDKFKEIVESSLSKYASGTDGKERIAELFSVMTSDIADGRGILREHIEFAEECLTGKYESRDGSEMTMDEDGCQFTKEDFFGARRREVSAEELALSVRRSQEGATRPKHLKTPIETYEDDLPRYRELVKNGIIEKIPTIEEIKERMEWFERGKEDE